MKYLCDTCKHKKTFECMYCDEFENRYEKIIKCEDCIHFDFYQSSKLFGHPCNLYGIANPYECKSFVDKNSFLSESIDGRKNLLNENK